MILKQYIIAGQVRSLCCPCSKLYSLHILTAELISSLKSAGNFLFIWIEEMPLWRFISHISIIFHSLTTSPSALEISILLPFQKSFLYRCFSFWYSQHSFLPQNFLYLFVSPLASCSFILPPERQPIFSLFKYPLLGLKKSISTTASLWLYFLAAIQHFLAFILVLLMPMYAIYPIILWICLSALPPTPQPPSTHL